MRIPLTAHWSLSLRDLVLAAAVLVALGLIVANLGATDAAGPSTSTRPHAFPAPLTTESILRACKDTTNPQGCYVHAYDHALRATGMEATLDLITQMAQANGVVAAGGHVYLHELGRLAAYYYGDPRLALAHCTDVYQSGCYHGVLEGYLGGKEQLAPSDIQGLCDPIDGGPQSYFRRHQCTHGMGHGLTLYFARDVFAAVQSCDWLGTDWDQGSCYTGAFMENAVAVGTDVTHGLQGRTPRGPMYRPDDPLYPCDAVADKYQWACYYLQTSLMLRLNGSDIAGMLHACDRAPAAYIPACYQSGGRDISSLNNQQAEPALQGCRLGTADYWAECYIGVLKDIAWSSEEPGYAICASVEPERRDRCYGGLGEVIGNLYTDAATKSERCGRVEAPYLAACRLGAGLG